MVLPVARDHADDRIPLTVTCQVLKLCRQQYYHWLDQPFTDAEVDEARAANAMFDARCCDLEFGYRFFADEVRAGDHAVSDRTVWRLCAEKGSWCSLGKKKRRRASAPATACHDDLVRR